MRYFTATHQPLSWPLPAFMEPVSTVPVGDGVTDLGAHFPELAGRGVELGEYATFFAIRRLLQQSWAEDGPPADDEMVGGAHYRRFAVTQPTGTPVALVNGVTPQTFTTLPEDTFLPPPGTLVVPSVVEFPASMLGFYGRNHPLRDLLHFLGLAIDLGVAQEADVAAFLNGKAMVPAPSVSVVPAVWLVEALEKVERVAQAFESTVGRPREGYQRRAIGFCCERLHSLLLLRLLVEWPRERLMMNRVLLVSEDESYHLGG